MNMVPKEVIAEDHRLERAASKASEELVKLRWHWTLDASNPNRVSLRVYAKAVGRAHSVIARDANAYVLVADVHAGANITVDEARVRANMGAETEAATEAVAKARGVSLRQASRARPTEVRRVRDWAREKAEKAGTSVEEEAPAIAQSIVRGQAAAQRSKEERRQRFGVTYLEGESELAKAQGHLTRVLNLAHDSDWDEEEVELLVESLAKVRAVLELIDRRLGGESEIDWDAELARL
jgi:hypothetical protein